ncbi:MAG: UvrD-helicase domain-containing protein [Candidatus Lindowbacteria bacterium]|nr:UvrD-helicase domain-containing protein [Candidatus Lindowbacteria bacterium]
MKYIGDFHIHSHFSRATSRDLIPEQLDRWARIKGIDVIGTGDCVHPGWLAELREKLEPCGNGLFRLKNEYRLKETFRGRQQIDVQFMLTTEISNIYKRYDKVRKVHNVCVFPDFDAVDRAVTKLERIGNLKSDGRPILGLDSRDLLEIILETADDSYLIPAHIWTPWFSTLGSKSGFDSVEECFADPTDEIFAVETGLSSDPPMNWACSFLDPYLLVSNSDAHSPGKLGREANLFDTELSYSGIYKALRQQTDGFKGTIEFFAQEGKYHYDGHRKCGVSWDPLETLKHGGICPVCSKSVTKGVMYRVAELADRADIEKAPNRRPYHSITPLPSLLSEILGKGPGTKTVMAEYYRTIEAIGSEFYTLIDAESGLLAKEGHELLAEGIRRLRLGEVKVESGYDGEFGKISVFAESELAKDFSISMFESKAPERTTKQTKIESIEFDIDKFKKRNSKNAQNEISSLITKEVTAEPRRSRGKNKSRKKSEAVYIEPTAGNFTDQQKQGIQFGKGVCIVIAGPGTGKTRVLTERVVYLNSKKSVPTENILTLTFSNRAANEIRERLKISLEENQPELGTFHSFGLSILKKHYALTGREKDFRILDEDEKFAIVKQIFKTGDRDTSRNMMWIQAVKEGTTHDQKSLKMTEIYTNALKILNAFDLDDLIYEPCRIFSCSTKILKIYRKQYPWLLIDEYQDINPMQYQLTTLLAGSGNPNLTVIGDPDQSIYGFRGCTSDMLAQLETQYPKAKTITLSQSFRCPDIVLQAGAQILSQKKQVVGRIEDLSLHVQRCSTSKSEADWIAAQIEKMVGGVRTFSIDSNISDGTEFKGITSLSDFAVLCRTRSMFGAITKAFADHGIPYQSFGVEPFYQDEHAKTLINLFSKLIDDPDDTSIKVLDSTRKLVQQKESVLAIFRDLFEVCETPEPIRRKFEYSSEPCGSRYADYLRSLALRQGLDDYDPRAEAVTLSTLHASKGLEFNTVLIAGCEDRMIPYRLFHEASPEELAEEERLFYVGVTRAKRYLFFSHADMRTLKKRSFKMKRSPLIDKINKNLYRSSVRKEKARPQSDQLDLFPTS